MEIEKIRLDLGALIGKMNELFQVINRNMTPATQLFALSGAPSSRVVRAVSLQKLALYGLFVLFISIPVVTVICILHNRIHEEEVDEETNLRNAATATPSVT
jgi:hypothetical protein